MKTYKITFEIIEPSYDSDKTKTTITIKTITVKHLGLLPAIEEAVRRMMCNPAVKGNFYPVKAEEIND